MQTSTSKQVDPTAHQTVTEFIKLQTPEETIHIGFTDQKVSGRAGLLTFAGFLQWHRFKDLLAKLLPHHRTSPNALPAVDLALGFIAGILSGAQKLAQVAHLGNDMMLSTLFGIERIGSQSTYTRFFQGFESAGSNLVTFRALWSWSLERLPSRPGGYSLDLDSSRLLHEDGHQEGVLTGYTRLGTKPCLHPLLAVLEEAKVVANFWLRPGNASCANNVVAFTLHLGSVGEPAPLDSPACGARRLGLLRGRLVGPAGSQALALHRGRPLTAAAQTVAAQGPDLDGQ